MRVEYVYSKPKKKHIKEIYTIIIILVISIVVLFLVYEQLPFYNADITFSECQDMMVNWCTNCFAENGNLGGTWENAGTIVGASLADCSNQYFNTEWTKDKDCTGNSIDYCLTYVQE